MLRMLVQIDFYYVHRVYTRIGRNYEVLKTQCHFPCSGSRVLVNKTKKVWKKSLRLEKKTIEVSNKTADQCCSWKSLKRGDLERKNRIQFMTVAAWSIFIWQIKLYRWWQGFWKRHFLSYSPSFSLHNKPFKKGVGLWLRPFFRRWVGPF